MTIAAITIVVVINASVMKLENITDLKSVAFGLVGSSPTTGTILAKVALIGRAVDL